MAQPLTDRELRQVADYLAANPPDADQVRQNLTPDERARMEQIGGVSGEGRTLGGFLRNAGRSALNTGRDLALAIPATAVQLHQFVTNPATASADLVGGVIDRAKRYSPSNIGTTLYEDPFGVALDASAALKGGAIGTRRMAPKLARTLDTASAVTNPATPLVAAAERAADAAPAMYQSALKPSTAQANRQNIGDEVATGLRERIPVNSRGLKKLRALETRLEQQAKQILAGTRGQVSARKVIADIRQLAAEWERQGRPESDIAAIREVADQFERNPNQRVAVARSLQQTLSAQGGQMPQTAGTRVAPAPMDVLQAQDFKVGSYRTVKEGFGSEKNATLEAHKRRAYSLKEGIEKVAPEVGPVNRRLADAYGLDPQLERAVAVESSRNPLSNAGTMIGVATGATAYGATGNPVLAGIVAALTKLMDSRSGRSQVALFLDALPEPTRGAIEAALLARPATAQQVP